MGLRLLMQVLLTKVGERCSPNHIRKLNSALNYLEVGRWLKANGFSISSRVADRGSLYSVVSKGIEREDVLYLEFGVYRGASLRAWSRLLHNPLSSLHGFDSFEGLPESWDSFKPKGTFDVKGKLPEFDDPRVVLHHGRFDTTLTSFILPKHQRLVINLDADLYSSTKFVLDTLQDAIKPGTIIIFDEFCDRLHELQAFSEFIEATRMTFCFLSATKNLERVAFERVS